MSLDVAEENYQKCLLLDLVTIHLFNRYRAMARLLLKVLRTANR